MEERARSCLLRSRAKMEADIKASYLMDHMVSDAVLTNEEEEKVKARLTRKEQAAALIDLILRKDNYTYISFYNALIREGYGDLASLLQSDLPLISPEAEKSFLGGGTPYVQTVLCEGGVPQRPGVFVSRPELINRIREKLYKLQKGAGWVTVFGMAGFGKSVLAAEALRDETLLKECFPGGVQWLSVGQLDKAGLLVKIQSLCFRLDQDSESSHRPPNSIEEARDRLRFLMLRKYPRSLLILDDIWDSVVLKAFDIQCRVLLTTRDRSLSDSVTGQKHEVSVGNGLEEDKALEVLALFVNKKVTALPEEARRIVHECKGSPLVVSLIGALLREFPGRWDYYLRQLQNKQFKRIRKSSSYDYEALDQAMSVSIDVLKEDLKEYYKDLTVLEKDVKVPAKVLSVLWDLEPEDVEDILQEFVNKSLLFRDCNQRPYLYYLHDLQLDFLSEQNRYRIQELHSKVVHQYQKHYKSGPPTTGDTECHYWFRYLGYHMANGNLAEELYSLLFSLDWVKTKARVMGPAHVINDYVEYRSMLDKENRMVRNNFQEFLSLNGHRLEQRPFPNVYQLGLSQPNSSEVYRQARLRAEEETKKGAFYLDWINKSSLESLSRLVVQPQKDSIYYACFSKDGERIASCGADGTVQVFTSTSGEKLLEMDAHEDEVLCCAFSPDDKLIATCSADKKIKIWNSQRGKLIRTYDEHSEQVNHCQFTNKSRRILLATCSNDGYSKLWNINKTGSQNTMFGHMESVNHCCFSPEDDYLASFSSDGTLKIWDVSSGNEWKSIDIKSYFPSPSEDVEEVDVIVKCGAWSADGSRVIAAARNTVFVFNVETSNLLSEIKTSRHSTIQSCDFCPTGQLVAIALSHFTVELWEIESNKKVADCSGHLSWVHCVRFSPDGSILLSSSDDQTVRLWETKKVHKSSSVCLKRDSDVLFDQDEITVLAADNRNHLQLRNGRTGQVIYQSEEQESRIRCSCLCKDPLVAALGRRDGTVKAGVMSPKQVLRSIGWWTLQLLTIQQSFLMALGLANGTVKVVEIPNGNIISTLTGHSNSVLHCQFTADGQTLITCSEDTTIRVWNWRSSGCKVLQGHTEQVKRFILLEDSRLLSWSFDGTVKVWSVITSELIQDITCHKGAILSCDVSPDGRKFASASADKSAKIWTFDSFDVLHVLSGHEACVRSCRFSWDNKCLATGDDNGEIKIWCAIDGTLLRVCTQDSKDSLESYHGGWVTDLHFSPDGCALISTGGYIKWWDVEKGEALQTFYTAGTNLKGIHVSPDFKTFVTIDNIGILYVLEKVE
ncbi:apoptotic protease-activating factor 1 isoform X1 [Amia ocellicauda]|uniref:apoptotic protease-activating factor 1 isoform X1 n=1 Tax=Amia ocellicauda TaxID=2972642 RepID=UPI003464E7B7